MTLPQTTATTDLSRLRDDFPILAHPIHGNKRLVYLDNAATTQRPRQVIQAIVETYERHYANVHRGIHWLSDQATDQFESAREKVRAFIHAQHAHEIIFTSGTTMSINLVARSWGDAFVRAGDEILLTEMEHHANLVPWQQLAQRVGCRLRHIPITDDGRLNLDQLPELINERTRLVAVTAASNVLGTINPLAPVVAAAKQVGARVLIDAAQSAAHLPLNVTELDADFVAFSGHKMMGPSGIGVLYGRESVLASMPPFLGGGSMIRRVYLDRFDAADLPAKFEAGTPPIVEAIGLGAAIDYLQQVGMDTLLSHERDLTQYAHQAMSGLPGLRLLGPDAAAKLGIVSFTLDSVHAHDIAQLLDRDGVAIRAGHHCTMPLHQRLGIHASARASFFLYNTRADIDQLVASLHAARAMFARRNAATGGARSRSRSVGQE